MLNQTFRVTHKNFLHHQHIGRHPFDNQPFPAIAATPVFAGIPEERKAE
jgi:hypothetical protein